MVRGLLPFLGYTAVFLGVAWARFSQRDIAS